MAIGFDITDVVKVGLGSTKRYAALGEKSDGRRINFRTPKCAQGSTAGIPENLLFRLDSAKVEPNQIA